MSLHDALRDLPARRLLRLSGLVLAALALCLVVLPLVVAGLLGERGLLALVRAALDTRPVPSAPPRWSAANTRTRTYATV